jgi:hypothetical protein
MVKDDEYKKIKEDLKDSEQLVLEIEAKINNLNSDFARVVELLMQQSVNRGDSQDSGIVEYLLPSQLFDKVSGIAREVSIHPY